MRSTASASVGALRQNGCKEAPQWRDLGGRAGEPNPFADSAFLIPATRHIAPRGLTALCVWGGPDRERLDALAILRRARAPLAIVDV